MQAEGVKSRPHRRRQLRALRSKQPWRSRPSRPRRCRARPPPRRPAAPPCRAVITTGTNRPRGRLERSHWLSNIHLEPGPWRHKLHRGDPLATAPVKPSGIPGQRMAVARRACSCITRPMPVISKFPARSTTWRVVPLGRGGRTRPAFGRRKGSFSRNRRCRRIRRCDQIRRRRC